MGLAPQRLALSSLWTGGVGDDAGGSCPGCDGFGTPSPRSTSSCRRRSPAELRARSGAVATQAVAEPVPHCVRISLAESEFGAEEADEVGARAVDRVAFEPEVAPLRERHMEGHHQHEGGGVSGPCCHAQTLWSRGR